MSKKQIQYVPLLILAWSMASFPAECFAQGYGVPIYGAGSYRPQNYNSGLGGRANRSSFNGGFGCLSNQAQAMPQASTQASSQPNGFRSAGTMAELEQTLNAVDTRAGWAQTPLSGVQNMAQAPAQPVRTAPSQGVPPDARRVRRPGNTDNNRGGMFPGVSRQELTRIFFEGGTPQMGGSAFSPGLSPAGSSQNASTAYSNYQTAENESTKARNDANTARYDTSKWNRKDAATRAEYAANNADYAAQRAESAAYSGDSQARSYANLARQAANRARASANQARYNAETIP